MYDIELGSINTQLYLDDIVRLHCSQFHEMKVKKTKQYICSIIFDKIIITIKHITVLSLIKYILCIFSSPPGTHNSFM